MESSTEVALTPQASAAAATEAIRESVRRLTVEGPDVQALLDAVSADLEIAPTVEVDSDELADELRVMLGRISTARSAAEDQRMQRKRLVLDVGTWLDEGYKPVLVSCDEVIAGGRTKLDAWSVQQRLEAQRQREAAEAKAREDARLAAEAEAATLAAANAQAAEAQKLRDAGSEQAAQAMEAQAMALADNARQTAAAAVVTAMARPVSTGRAMKAQSVKWKAECTDKAKLLQHIGALIAAGDKSLIGLVEIDPKAINKLAEVQEAGLNVPGLRPYSEGRTAPIKKVAVAA